MRVFCSLFLGILVSGTALGQQAVTVLMRNRSVSAESFDGTVSELVGELNRTTGILAVAPAKPISREEALTAATRSRELLEEARDRYRKFDQAGALEKLEESLKALLHQCTGADADLIRGQLLLRGLIHYTAGSRDKASAAFAELAAAFPSWEPDPAELAPKIVAAFQESRELVMKRPKAQIDLSGHPRGAKILLNGREAGSLPVVLQDLLPGGHCLQAAAPGHAPWASRVTLPERGSVRLRIDLFPERAGALVTGGPGLPTGSDQGEWARLFGNDFLLLGDIQEQEVSAYLVSAESGKASAKISCKPPDTAKCLREGVIVAAAGLKEPGPRASKPPLAVKTQPPKTVPAVTDTEVKPVPADGEPQWYQRWWFWTLVGSAVAAGCAVGLGYLLQPEPTNEGYQVVVTRPPR